MRTFEIFGSTFHVNPPARDESLAPKLLAILGEVNENLRAMARQHPDNPLAGAIRERVAEIETAANEGDEG